MAYASAWPAVPGAHACTRRCLSQSIPQKVHLPLLPCLTHGYAWAPVARCSLVRMGIGSFRKRSSCFPKMVDEDDQRASSTLDTVKYHLGEAADKTSKAVEEGIHAAAYATKSGIVKARVEYDHLQDRSQSFLETGYWHYKQTEEQAFAKLRDGVHIAAEHPTASLAALGGLALLVLPGPRRLLWRQTLGRLRSEEAVYTSAVTKAQYVGDATLADAAEAEKLLQRQSAAREQFDQGLAKLRATSRQLQSLASRVKATEHSAERLIKTLRELPSKEALALRSEVATVAAASRRQRAALEKAVYRTASRYGV